MFHIKRAYLVVIFGLFAQLALSILNVSVLIAVVFRFQPNHAGCDTEGGCGWGTTFTLCAIVILIHLWQASVLTNVVLVINAGGTFSPWYFDNGNLGTRQSLKLAMTRSLGSIAWGSLLVGIIELIHKFFHMMEQALSSNPCTACCCKILSCFTMILKKLIEKFNRYVYIFIAVGRPSLDPPVESFSDDFRAAARHTLQFFGRRGKHDTAIARSQGLASLVDDSIVDLSLTAAAFVTGMLCVGFTYLYMYVVDDKAVSNHSYNWGILIYAFISSHSICLLLTSALDAGVSTIFVCISEDESRLEDKAPDLYQLIVGNARYQAIFPGVARSQPVRKEGSIGQMTDIAKRLV
ncbi:choline transporter-like protein [Naematelia encephala]|uniref:Protein PNS1 n=1 Tax=Naematelia encephala TaxID=71784 RepID=A0A1Y2B4P4_9TREE|nr:choline transporter-like protein [Naematelia encephala]